MNCRIKWILTVMALASIPYVILVHIVHRNQFQVTNMQAIHQLLPMTSISKNKQQLQETNKTLMTMFTTFKKSEQKRIIYENTIRIWQLLWPEVIPILFTELNRSDPKTLAHYAVQQGWHVLPVPKTSPRGIPVLRHMFLEAQKRFNTAFYCYANGDILFDRNLTDTVRFLQTALRGRRSHKLLVIGQRRNWSLKEETYLTELLEVGHYTKNSSLFITDAQDYFLTTRDGYPWRSIPDFVVGRVGYDNWIVVTALVKHIPVVDATATVTALHQTGRDGNEAGRQSKSEATINLRLAQGFEYGLGHSTCAQFATQCMNKTIYITDRKLTNKTCHRDSMLFVRNPFVWIQYYILRGISINHRYWHIWPYWNFQTVLEDLFTWVLLTENVYILMRVLKG